PAPIERRGGRLPRAREPEHEHLPWQLSHSPVTVAATDPLLRARPRSRSLCRGVAVSRGWLPPGLVLAEAGEVEVVQREADRAQPPRHDPEGPLHLSSPPG